MERNLPIPLIRLNVFFFALNVSVISQPCTFAIKNLAEKEITKFEGLQARLVLTVGRECLSTATQILFTVGHIMTDSHAEVK
jgi:hypothetical protein